MGDTWITDMRHFLDEDGLMAEIPTPAMNLALFQGSIVSWMTRMPITEIEQTNVNCRRHPGRKRCLGEIVATFEEGGEAIAWTCPFCGDNGVIRGWAGTIWDRSS